MVKIYCTRKSIVLNFMRISLLIASIQVCFISLLMAESLKAQDLKINASKLSVKEVFIIIEKQTDIHFVYDEQILRGLDKLTIQASKKTLTQILESISMKVPLKFKQAGKMIGVSMRSETFKSPPVKSATGQLSVVDITGQVTDSKMEGLPGVTIMVKGSHVSTATDPKGRFKINAALNSTLVFKMIGFVSQEVKVSGNTLNIIMTEDLKGLNEVVVVGYGTQRKRDLTGAISSVKAADLVMTSNADIGHMLKGKAAGLMIIENSAQPGGGLKIQIRGAGSINASNDPLIVVDGFPISDLSQPDSIGRYNPGTQSILNSFNPNDIESIEVLKDASSTAIYGSRAANGVILITTKRGKEGKAVLQYSVTQAFQQYNNSYDVFALDEWMAEINHTKFENWKHYNHVIPYGTRTLEEAFANPLDLPYEQPYTDEQIKTAGKGTDWLGLVTRNGQIQQHNLSLSGGNKATRFLISGNYYGHEGVIKKSGMKRYSFRTNLDHDLSKYVKLGVNLTASRIQNANSQLGSGEHENSGIIRAAIAAGPHIQAIDENGNYPLNPESAMRPNPYSLLTITDDGRIERILANSFVDVTPLKNLTIKFKAGLDRGFSKRSIYQPRTTLFGSLENGIGNIAEKDNESFLYEGTVNYALNLQKKHALKFLVGASKQNFLIANSSLGNSGFITDAFLFNNLNAGTGTKTVSTSKSENLIASYFSRFNYAYDDKYIVQATLRTDGASVFAVNHKWATFPSASVGWNVDAEPWFEPVRSIVSALKLRLSYGMTGNASIGTNAFASYTSYPGYLSGNDIPVPAVALSRLENPNLKWETTTSYNFGVDYALFNNRVTGSLEIYQNVISDLLNYKSLNSYNVINRVMDNIGTTQSKGFELSINSNNLMRKDFTWKTTLNLSRFNDTWKKRADNWAPSVYMKATDPIRAVYSLLSDGILQVGDPVPAAQPLLEPGQVKIKDVDGYQRNAAGQPVVDGNGRFILLGTGDGIIDDADIKLIGRKDPTLVVGFTNIFTYKNFSLNFDFNGLFGRRMIDPNFVAFGINGDEMVSKGYNSLKTIRDRWTPVNPSTTQPSGFSSKEGYGDFFYQEAWFIRLQNLSLGYDLPKKLLRNICSGVRLNVGANNLFVVTPYKGIDPETDAYAAAYPNIRTLTLSLNVTF